MRLTSKLVILLITAVFVPIVLISSVIIRQHQHAYTQALLEQEKEIAIRLANDIDHFIAKKRDMLKLAGSAFFLQQMARLEVDFLLALLLKSDSEIRWVAILDTQGRELTRMSRTEAVLRDDLIDRSADTWFQAALHGTSVTSSVFFTMTNEPYVRLYIPVPLYNQNLLGVIIGEVHLKTLWEQVLKAKVEPHGFAFVVTREGTVIAHPEKLFVLQKQRFDDIPAVQRGLREGGTAIYHDPFLNEAVTSAFVPLQEINGTVIIVQPKQYTFAANRLLVARMAMVALACLVVAMGIGGIFGYHVVRPILRLIRDVQTMRRTESNAIRPLGVRGRDEIDTLTASFHAMRQEVLDTSSALLSAKYYMENIIGSMREALLVIAPTGTIQLANPAICALLGYADTDLLGQPFIMILPSHFVPEHAWFDSLMHDGSLSGVETALTTKGGHRIPVAFSASVMRSHQREIQGIVCVAQDITERKQAEEALRQSKEAAEEGSRAKSTFLATMSHELRTPLSSVIGFANLLLRKEAKTLAPQNILYLERIRTNGVHLLGLINDILDLSKVEAGHMELDIAPTALAGLIQEVLEHLADTAHHPAVQVRVDIPQSLAPLATDAGRLKQILLNLVGNALKFTPRGTVTIQVESDPVTQQPRRIDVIDTGIGISPERLEGIFERFQQADNSTARKYGGTGLGLAISRALCQLLGYQLTVQSTVGQGSTFCIIMPV